jgi:hypothetical protein
LIELLVVVAVIAVLIAILLPALGKAKRTARQAATGSAVRQLAVGYTLAYQENDGRLMYGYPPAYIDGQTLSVTLPTGQTIPGPGSFAGSLSILRYPARLAPYENSVWSVMYQDQALPGPAPAMGDSVAAASSKAYMLSLYPSFGLNSVFLGGDAAYWGFTGSSPNYHVNRGGPAIFRASAVERPGQTILFAEAKHRNAASGLTGSEEGFFRLTPPVAGGRQWRYAGGKLETMASGDIGLPEGRAAGARGRVVTAFFDTHVESLTPKDLDDMRLWTPAATSAEYDFQHP